MPLYIGDYLKKTQRLQAEQHGAYLLLLMEAWQSGGSIPDDPEELASIARVPLERWQTHTSAKILPFFEHREGRYWSGRVCEELARATAVVEKRAQAGAAGAAARWQTHGKRMASGMASESQKDAPSPLQPQDELQTTSVANPAVSPAAVARCPQAEIVALWGEVLPECRQPAKWDGVRAVNLASRWREDERRQSLDWWRKLFRYIDGVDFLMGRTKPSTGHAPFRLGLDWLVQKSNFLKVIEGAYDNA